MLETLIESIETLRERSRLRKIRFSRVSRRQKAELDRFDKWLRGRTAGKESALS